MANEFKHKDPGSTLTSAEFIASDGTGHIFDSQATGDVLYASSTTALARLGVATNGNVLELSSGLPAWTSTPTIGSTSWSNANHAHAATNSGGTLTTLGTVATGVWQGTAIATTYIAADAITGAKIADDAIDSEHYTDGSIDNAHIADDAIDSEHYAAGSIDTAHIANLQITTGLIAADAVTGAKIADDAINSEHYTDGSIDNAHLADDAVDSDELAAGAVDTAHIGDNQVTAAKIFDLARGSVLVGNASAATAELTIGSNTYVLASDGTDIAWTAVSSGPSPADQAALEAETNEDTYAPPDLIKHSPGVGKQWAHWAADGTIDSGSYNTTSVARNSTGNYTVTIATDHSDANYNMAGSLAASDRNFSGSTTAAGTYIVVSTESNGTVADSVTRAGTWGDQ